MSDPVIQKFQMRAKDGAESLTVTVFGGRLSLSVWPKDARKPTFKYSFTPDATTVLRRCLDQIRAAQPGTRLPFLIGEWKKGENGDRGKYEINSAIQVGKDDKQMYYFELQFTDEGNRQSIRFDLSMPGSIQLGDSPLSFPDRSDIRLETLINWIKEYVPAACLATAKPFTKKSYGGGSGGGSSSGGGGSSFGGNSSAPFS